MGVVSPRQTLLKRLIPAVSCALAFVILFAFLYAFDNKFTAEHYHVEDGSAVIEENYLAAHQVLFLVSGWELYPDILLSPNEVGEFAFDNEASISLFIGQYGGLQAGRDTDTTHGMGTYRLTLVLPDEEREYALRIPEVFSAYRFYVDGELIGAMGDPDPDSYEVAIQNTTYVFTASGKTELVVAASDYSAVYSGMTYPPALGSLDAVDSYTFVGLIIRSIILTIVLIAAAVSIGLALSRKLWQGWLFALSCLFFIGCSSYPIIHSLFTTDVQPWYTIEMVSYYAMLSTAVILQSDACGMRGRLLLYPLVPCVLFVIFAGVYAIMAPSLSLSIAAAFSFMSMAFKIAVALYLVVLAGVALVRDLPQSTLLLSGSLVFAVALAADRAMPLYEPIYGAWFGEIGGLVLILFIQATVWVDFFKSYRLSLMLSEQKRLMTQQIRMQLNHYDRLSEQIDETHRAQHDLRHHMVTLGSLAQNKDWDELSRYLATWQPDSLENSIPPSSGNAAVDALLLHYQNESQRTGTSFSISCALPTKLRIPVDDLVIILGNLLENAFLAQIRSNAEMNRVAYVNFNAGLIEDQLVIVVENSYEGMMRPFGIGIQSVQTVTERYGGISSFEATGVLYRATVMIPE